MKIAILGFAREGRAAYDYWNNQGNDIAVCDRNESLKIPAGLKSHLGKDYLKGLDEYDLIVRAPSLHPRDIVAANPETPDILNKVTSVTNEFFRVSPTKNIIAVTGTKGKGTTSTLITRMLEADGKRVHLGGNIGIAVLELLKSDIKPTDWVVLELSSYQLIDLRFSPPITVCLMIEPDHQDWHIDFKEYIEAKSQLFKHQNSDGIAIYNANDKHSLNIAQAGGSKQLIPYMKSPGAHVTDTGHFVIDGQQVCAVNEVQLRGRHNWQNICAALTAVWQVTHNTKALHTAITTFTGLPHRLEEVREVNGVHYFNDSFASAPPATMAALEAIPGQKVLIVGGYDRGLDLTELADSIAKHQGELRKVIIIGASAIRLKEALKAKKFNNYETLVTKNITDIVDHAKTCSKPGDFVLFSPGFASFDMFKDFEERGEHYKAAVLAL